MKALTSINIFADGRTEPFVEYGTPIILIKEGTISVGRLCHGGGDVFIEHPENEYALNVVAMQIVEAKKPELLKSETSIIVICPQEIEHAMIWKSL